MHSFIRFVAFTVGLGILATVAHVAIVSTGGYGEPAAAMVIALACGVAIGAVAIGIAVSHGQRALAAFLVIALLAGEGFGLLRTADMLVTGREAQQLSVRSCSSATGPFASEARRSPSLRPSPGLPVSRCYRSASTDSMR